MVEIAEEELLQLISEGKTKNEIADIKGVTYTTVRTRISKIDKIKVQQAELIAKQKVEQQILELIREGKTKKEIGKIYNVAETTIVNWLARIDNQELVKEAKKQGKQSKKNNAGYQIKREKINIDVVKNKLDENTLTKQDIQDFRKQLDRQAHLMSFEEIAVMIKVYIKTNHTSDALKFINSIIRDQDIYNVNIESLLELKDKIIEVKQRQEVKAYLDRGFTTSQIAEITGVMEIKVIQIKRQMDSKELEMWIIKVRTIKLKKISQNHWQASKKMI